MNAAEFFAAAERLPIGLLADVTGGRGLVVVAPHPDDESLGCGGLIAESCASGFPVRLIVVSDGVGSHRNSKQYPPQRLRDLREEETLRAVSKLGLAASAVRFLRLPDQDVPTEGAEAVDACAAIVEAARLVDAGAIFVTWEHDPHCDHVASAVLVAEARRRLPEIRVFHYPIWGPTLDPKADVGPLPKGFRFDIRRHATAKAAAIAAHRSQTGGLIHDDPDGFTISPTMIAQSARDFEIFIEVQPISTRHLHSLPASYFDELYARNSDPWRFASSPYERDKYKATLEALPRTRYGSALEVGCSIGILTQHLADRADMLLAVDVASKALIEAKCRCAGLGSVNFELVRTPRQWPNGRFDLIVLSEVVYYLDRSDVNHLAERVRQSIEPNGDIVLVHWLGETDYPLSGREAAEQFTASTTAWARCLVTQTKEEYRLDVLRAGG